jgi:SAM-dependent methyltransferase
MVVVTSETVEAHFDQEALQGRRLFPDRNTVSGLGTWRKYERAADLMADPSVHDVIDIGCNRGSIEVLMKARHPDRVENVRVAGVDVSREAIGQAKALGFDWCTFDAYDGRTLPFPDESFDLAVLVEVIEHVMDKESLLREIRRVLRPSGRLFLTTPNPECVALRTESVMWHVLRTVFRRPMPAKDQFITSRDLTAALDAAGLERVGTQAFSWPHAFIKIWNWGIVPPLPPSWLYRYQQFCLRRFERPGVPEWLARRLYWSLVTLLRRR